MKIFQIVDGFCYWDATMQFPTLQSTVGKFPPNVLFVEAPDYVFEDWGYDDTEIGDARFIKPIPPEGFVYDPQTGTYYPEGFDPNVVEPTEHDDLVAMVVDLEYRLTLMELGVTTDDI